MRAWNGVYVAAKSKINDQNNALEVSVKFKTRKNICNLTDI